MMIQFKTWTPILFAALALAGCAEKGLESGQGRISIALSADDTTLALTRASLDLDKPAAADFSLTIADDTGTTIGEWASIADFDESAEYPVGNYLAKASHGNTMQEDFETPCFEGTQAFTLLKDQTTSVIINASIANAVVTLDWTDAFRNYFSDYAFTLITATSTELPFAAGETRRAFIHPGTFRVTGTATTQTGSSIQINKEFTDIAARTLYQITFDVNGGNVGSATVTISFNDEPVAEIPINIELNDTTESFDKPY